MTPRIGLIIPTNWGDQPPPYGQLLDFCRRADELGFDSLWVIDRLFHQHGVPHPMVMLAQAAAVTRRIGLGTGVVLLSVRHPVDLAQSAATLNALSGERLTLGVSLGGRDNEYTATNMPKEQRLGRLVEGVEVMRRLWTQREVTFKGRYYSLDAANIEPKPRREGGIPIVFGATTKPSLARAGRLADGWMQGGRGTPESYAEAWQTVLDSAAKAGRDAGNLESSKLFYVNPVADEARASRELEQYLSLYYGPGYPMEHTAPGPPAMIAERVLAYGEAGCQLVILGLPGPDTRKLELLASEVVPCVAKG
jgi:probable F420-dependent oxidoreductase